jgi:1,4-alpha-glucan branching enzyme
VESKKTTSETRANVGQAEGAVVPYSVLTDYDIHLFREGSHYRMYRKFGAHRVTVDGTEGVAFAVWAPNAEYVSVIGDFNSWDKDAHPLRERGDGSGVWEGFIPNLAHGRLYKYHIRSRHNGFSVDKGDPLGFYWEMAPYTATVTWDLAYDWNDGEWMKTRRKHNGLDAPMSIYEVHLGSWQRKVEEGNRSLTYREIADSLVNYVKEMGFTHVELMPVAEHPLFRSWGYQVVGYYAPTSRYGTPQDLMYLIDVLHRNGIGVILDWVPSHFPSNENGLVYFDGTHLYEHADPRKGFHPEWATYIFNYGRNEVKNFLISNALFWLDHYHIDGLRVDAVASMLYLDYGRKEGEWIPNEHGGKENVEAVEFLRKLNEAVYGEYPGVQTTAEESTSWAAVSRPTSMGGLGFGMKWDMGWMHDTLDYMTKDPIHRKHHHNSLTFGIMYLHAENFVLPLSHDEVVYGKRSLLNKMPGDDWQKFANLRLLLGYMWTRPGKKLLFMGGEFGQWNEWNQDVSLDWHLLGYPPHDGVRRWLTHLNMLYRGTPSLYEQDFEDGGFRWVDCHDDENSVISYIRYGRTEGDMTLVVCSFTPVPRHNYRLGVPLDGRWNEVLNSDAPTYGGSGQGNLGGVVSTPVPMHEHNQSVSITLPPLGMVVFKPAVEPEEEPAKKPVEEPRETPAEAPAKESKEKPAKKAVKKAAKKAAEKTGKKTARKAAKEGES